MSSTAASLAVTSTHGEDTGEPGADLRFVSPPDESVAAVAVEIVAAPTVLDLPLVLVPQAAPDVAATAGVLADIDRRTTTAPLLGARPERTPEEEEQVLATWELVRAAQAGDTDAFGQLYDRYVDIVFRYVLFRVNDRTLAEDLTSETFLRALRRIASITYQGKDVGAWFVTIARNIVLDYMKSSRHRLEFSTAEILDSDSADDPEDEVITASIVAELLDCVRQLGDDQRECIVLRFLQGMSVSETAAAMGRNEGAVKALQHRAVRRLAKLVPDTLR
ncbi:sigma-70 family RNA polymerase sigma factor [Rhodococcus sp. X156]|uniref:sigma-70 family RNA polymerase sigma factor n=1 Tax=Rhodococcus sp. X156 TaxID=2499145 RepID=UPI000FD84C52|nr:sigma-70 family RNA polymerase sigma factor [Rhodococcus sp. X156]